MMKTGLDDQKRTFEQIQEHYKIERDLADTLRNAPQQSRGSLYASLYNELFKRIVHHPQLTRKASPQESQKAVSQQIKFIKPYLGKETLCTTFLEMGPGDCALSFEIAKLVKKVYAVDVSDEITKASVLPKNFHLILSNGSDVSLSPESIHVAYSNQLMEHLHPDDAIEQLTNIYKTLVSGGVYICITPNRLSGPHDISRYFDEVATGFHLKEYSTLELISLFRKVGFSRVKLYTMVKGQYLRCPLFLIAACEGLLSYLPHRYRKSVPEMLRLNFLIDIRLVAIK